MKRASEFAMVRAKGTSEAGRFVVINLAALPENQAGQHSRFGIITTKRIGHAVVRNLLRRRMREILREHGDPVATGRAIVIVMRNRAAFADYHQLEADFLKTLSRHLKKQQPC